MKKYLMLMVTLAGMASAGVLVVDDFESYADDAALQAKWVVNTSSNVTGETIENVLNGQSMLLTNNSNSPYYSQTKFALPGAVHNVHGVNLTYPGYYKITLTLAIPTTTDPTWGALGGTGGRVFLSMYDCWGQKVLGANYTTGATPSGTGWPNGVVWEVDFATALVSGMNLENVEQITVGYNNTYNDLGALFIDDVTFVSPEPATLALLGLGSLAILRKRK